MNYIYQKYFPNRRNAKCCEFLKYFYYRDLLRFQHVSTSLFANLLILLSWYMTSVRRSKEFTGLLPFSVFVAKGCDTSDDNKYRTKC